MTNSNLNPSDLICYLSSAFRSEHYLLWSCIFYLIFQFTLSLNKFTKLSQPWVASQEMSNSRTQNFLEPEIFRLFPKIYLCESSVKKHIAYLLFRKNRSGSPSWKGISFTSHFKFHIFFTIFFYNLKVIQTIKGRLCFDYKR